MQLPSNKSNPQDDIKTQFRAREGYYRLMNSPDYFQKPHRNLPAGGLGQNGNLNSNSDSERCEKTWIRISLVTVNDNNDPIVGIKQHSHPSDQNTSNANMRNFSNRRSRTIRDRKICLNIGQELFIYNYDGIRSGPDSTVPLIKKLYKGNTPICHDFNQSTATSTSIRLLVGFSQGQIQLIEFSSDGCEREENFKEFNSDRVIDKTRVTRIKWLPNSPSLFLVGHASGHLYLYKDDLSCCPTAPIYSIFKQSEGVIVYTCKSKASRTTTRNPIYKWSIGLQAMDSTGSSHSLGASSSSLHYVDNECYSLNDFAFSPCSKYLACVSQDGFLRVFCYDTMEMVGKARSYYGGMTCVCWSPDGKYVVSGGEDDLITIWSFVERKVVARAMGHKSWVSVVSFDNFHSGHPFRESDVDNYDDEDDDRELDDICPSAEVDDNEEDEILPYNQDRFTRHVPNSSPSKNINQHDSINASHDIVGSSNSNNRMSSQEPITSYRFGSVGHDTQLCFWDLSDDLLKQHSPPGISNSIPRETTEDVHHASNTRDTSAIENTDLVRAKQGKQLSLRSSGFAKSFSLIGKRDKRNMSQRGTSKSNATSHGNPNLLGTPMCPRMNEVPVIQPLLCKKISYERLTSLIFLKAGFITSCQEGYIYSWARP